MAQWRFVAARTAPNSSVLLGEITEAHDRQVDWKLDVCQASFTIDGRHELATLVPELTVDLLAYRDDVLVFRGRLGASNDDVSTEDHNVSLTALDYTSILRRRDIPSPQAPWAFSAVAQGSIVRQLIDWAESVTGGNLDITTNSTNVPNTATTRTITYPVGKWVGEAIDELGALDSGFDWTIDETLTARLWSPTRGSTSPRDLVLEYGSTVSAVRRSFDPAEYANAITVTGADGVAAQYATAVDLATRPEGRFDYVLSLPDVSSTSILSARATAELADRSVIRPSYACTLTPGRWSPGEISLGDLVWLEVHSGRLNVSGAQRAVEIVASIDDNGAETVDITLGRLAPKVERRLLSTNRRLAKVERLGAV